MICDSRFHGWRHPQAGMHATEVIVREMACCCLHFEKARVIGVNRLRHWRSVPSLGLTRAARSRPPAKGPPANLAVVAQFEFSVGLVRLGNPLRNVLMPISIEQKEPNVIIQDTPQDSGRIRMANPNRTNPFPMKPNPNIQAAIRWTMVGAGDPLQKKASTERAFRTMSGKTMFRWLALVSSINLSRSGRWPMPQSYHAAGTYPIHDATTNLGHWSRAALPSPV